MASLTAGGWFFVSDEPFDVATKEGVVVTQDKAFDSVGCYEPPSAGWNAFDFTGLIFSEPPVATIRGETESGKEVVDGRKWLCRFGHIKTFDY